VIVASGTVRLGGTATNYLPLAYPAVPSFPVLRRLVESAEELNLPTTVGVGAAGDAFYAPHDPAERTSMKDNGLVFVEMESDTLFIVGQLRHWRTGAIFTSDGGPGKTKPESGEAAYHAGEENAIRIALNAMWKIAQEDLQK
jgi:uridine phosphorylase